MRVASARDDVVDGERKATRTSTSTMPITPTRTWPLPRRRWPPFNQQGHDMSDFSHKARPSSSAAASWDARPPITWPIWAGTSCCLERKKLTSGTTFHAAGLVGQLRSNANITQLLGYSVDLYKRLEAETGQATGWKMNGGLRLACNEERWTEVKRQATTAHSLWPRDAAADALRGQGTLAADAASMTWSARPTCPPTGRRTPRTSRCRWPRARGKAGATIFEDTKVTEIDLEDGVIKGVDDRKGPHRLRPA